MAPPKTMAIGQQQQSHQSINGHTVKPRNRKSSNKVQQATVQQDNKSHRSNGHELDLAEQQQQQQQLLQQSPANGSCQATCSTDVKSAKTSNTKKRSINNTNLNNQSAQGERVTILSSKSSRQTQIEALKNKHQLQKQQEENEIFAPVAKQRVVQQNTASNQQNHQSKLKQTSASQQMSSLTSSSTSPISASTKSDNIVPSCNKHQNYIADELDDVDAGIELDGSSNSGSSVKDSGEDQMKSNSVSPVMAQSNNTSASSPSSSSSSSLSSSLLTSTSTSTSTPISADNDKSKPHFGQQVSNNGISEEDDKLLKFKTHGQQQTQTETTRDKLCKLEPILEPENLSLACSQLVNAGTTPPLNSSPVILSTQLSKKNVTTREQLAKERDIIDADELSIQEKLDSKQRKSSISVTSLNSSINSTSNTNNANNTNIECRRSAVLPEQASSLGDKCPKESSIDVIESTSNDMKKSLTSCKLPSKSTSKHQSSIQANKKAPQAINVASGSATKTLCKICGQHVYQMERMLAEKSIYHKQCFRCNQCKIQLLINNYASHEGQLYCKAHHRQILQPQINRQNQDQDDEENSGIAKSTTKQIDEYLLNRGRLSGHTFSFLNKTTEGKELFACLTIADHNKNNLISITESEREIKTETETDLEMENDKQKESQIDRSHNNNKIQPQYQSQTIGSRQRQMIICENEPAELPEDVVRCDTKPDDGIKQIKLNLNNILEKFERGNASNDDGGQASPSAVIIDKPRFNIKQKLAAFENNQVMLRNNYDDDDDDDDDDYDAHGFDDDYDNNKKKKNKFADDDKNKDKQHQQVINNIQRDKPVVGKLNGNVLGFLNQNTTNNFDADERNSAKQAAVMSKQPVKRSESLMGRLRKFESRIAGEKVEDDSSSSSDDDQDDYNNHDQDCTKRTSDHACSSTNGPIKSSHKSANKSNKHHKVEVPKLSSIDLSKLKNRWENSDIRNPSHDDDNDDYDHHNHNNGIDDEHSLDRNNAGLDKSNLNSPSTDKQDELSLLRQQLAQRKAAGQGGSVRNIYENAIKEAEEQNKYQLATSKRGSSDLSALNGLSTSEIQKQLLLQDKTRNNFLNNNDSSVTNNNNDSQLSCNQKSQLVNNDFQALKLSFKANKLKERFEKGLVNNSSLDDSDQSDSNEPPAMTKLEQIQREKMEDLSVFTDGEIRSREARSMFQQIDRRLSSSGTTNNLVDRKPKPLIGSRIMTSSSSSTS